MKKAQMTAFVIIGIVIVLSFIFFFMLKGRIEREEIAPSVSMIVEELPAEFMPVKLFVENCLEKTAIQAIIIAGERGGYIYTDKLNTNNIATEGDSVRFSQQSDLILPYWFYMASDNRCTGQCEFSSKKLPLKKNAYDDSIESQLSRYVEENIGDCIDGFKSMDEIGFKVKEEGKLKAKFIITEHNVVVHLDYPIVISRQQSKIEITNFYTTIDVDLNKIYRMGDYITKLEQDYRFLESHTLNLIDGFSGKDSRMLPPRSEASFELGKGIKWTRSIVKRNIRQILSSYIPMLRMVDTLSWKEVDTGNKYIDKLYNYGMAIPNNISINDLSVSFNYLDFWDIYFDINCKGEICEPESAFTDILPIGMQRYNFAYDISVPVLVEIVDPSAFNNRGYTFNFMLESNLRNNQPMPAFFNPAVFVDEHGSLLCDENKRNSGEITFKFIDSLTGAGIDNVDIYYTCIESCYIGEAENSGFVSGLPICLGGMLSFRSEGYDDKFMSYDTELDREDSIIVEMNPKKEYKVEIKKKEMKKLGDDWVFVNDEKELADYESAVITFIRDNYFEILEFANNSEEKISLSEGEYEIEINMLTENEYYVPQQTMEVNGESITSEEFKTDMITNGMTKLNYTFTKEDLAKEKITLYVLSADLLGIPVNERKIDDLSVTASFEDYSVSYYNELKPRVE